MPMGLSFVPSISLPWEKALGCQGGACLWNLPQKPDQLRPVIQLRKSPATPHLLSIYFPLAAADPPERPIL